jgi:hypothetical protein
LPVYQANFSVHFCPVDQFQSPTKQPQRQPTDPQNAAKPNKITTP